MARAPENFAEMVKEVRKQLGLSQEELAHELGVSFATINRWENAKTVPFNSIGRILNPSVCGWWRKAS